MTIIENPRQQDKYLQNILIGRGYEVINRKIDFVYVGKKWVGTWIIYKIKKDNEIEFLPTVLKRAFFYTFFQQFENESGFGETINYERLAMYLREPLCKRIWFCYSDGSVFESGKEEWKKYVVEHNTVRIQDKMSEYTTSVPIQILRRVDRTWTSQSLTNWCVKSKIPRNIIEKLVWEFQKLKERIWK